MAKVKRLVLNNTDFADRFTKLGKSIQLADLYTSFIDLLLLL